MCIRDRYQRRVHGGNISKLQVIMNTNKRIQISSSQKHYVAKEFKNPLLTSAKKTTFATDINSIGGMDTDTTVSSPNIVKKAVSLISPKNRNNNKTPSTTAKRQLNVSSKQLNDSNKTLHENVRQTKALG
eukprot:TRINITY_DN5508_c0_g1_i18.p2 TRINITY_DN5508_c0_g1~~TRINITY_DN5508_c0_g1_i18.p2  ORF type:complete len:130 (-),score=26.63 TRINITY_DN5508_c0_g1_i18:1260-1649(-)